MTKPDTIQKIMPSLDELLIADAAKVHAAPESDSSKRRKVVKKYLVDAAAIVEAELPEGELLPLKQKGQRVAEVAIAGMGLDPGDYSSLPVDPDRLNQYFVAGILSAVKYKGEDAPKNYQELAYCLEDGSAEFTR